AARRLIPGGRHHPLQRRAGAGLGIAAQKLGIQPRRTQRLPVHGVHIKAFDQRTHGQPPLICFGLPPTLSKPHIIRPMGTAAMFARRKRPEFGMAMRERFPDSKLSTTEYIAGCRQPLTETTAPDGSWSRGCFSS